MQIDFYTGSSNKLQTTCQLCQKAMSSGLRTVVSVPDARAAQMLDTLLWDFPKTAFIPHCRSDAPDAARTPVVIHQGLQPQFPYFDLLINLHPECPDFFDQFKRMIEVISTDAHDSQQGRLRYKQYRDAGHTLRHFDLNKPS